MQNQAFQVIAITPSGFPEWLENPAIAISASRAGALGVINCEGTSNTLVLAAVKKAQDLSDGPLGLRLFLSDLEKFEAAIEQLARVKPATIILVADENQDKKLIKEASKLKSRGFSLLLECVRTGDFLQTAALQSAGLKLDGILVKGNEAGGRVGEETSFVLAQQAKNFCNLPYYIYGGVGPNTAAACLMAGASGIVLESQLMLTREAALPAETRQRLATFDGSETHLIPLENGFCYRAYVKAGHPLKVEGKAKAGNIAEALAGNDRQGNPLHRFLPMGQDVAFAGWLAEKYFTVAGVIDAITNSASNNIKIATKSKTLAANSPLALANGTEFPILQGAMTRVSDTAEFAGAVCVNGALPFLALSLMRKEEIKPLLAKTRELVSGRSWGVGLLGFVPQQLRSEQLECLKENKPPFAIIAGGRPDQAKELEEMDISTYLHVPSPLLLKSFAELGSRKFILEGKECGGHVGPRTSFVLWESMIATLMPLLGSNSEAGNYHVVFAGGIHDDLSASMTAAIAAPLAERGVKIGYLMGTAYLFTKEAVETGAIVEQFQQAALECDHTVLLETGPGHAIRCIDSPYKDHFDNKRHELEKLGKDKNEIRQELELMNLGRLRLASKGTLRKDSSEKQEADKSKTKAQPKKDAQSSTQKLVAADRQTQWADGMYMIGQVSAMHHKTFTMRELHEKVCLHGQKLLEHADHEIKEEKPQLPQHEDIAIVGMSCIFPKAEDLDAFWTNIVNKVDTIEEVPEEHWDWKKYFDENPLARDKIYSKWGGFLKETLFDPSRYGIPPSSLASIDPMQLLMLEVTRAAIKDAGYETRRFNRSKTSIVLANAGHGPITAFYSLRSMLDWKLADAPPEYRKILEDKLPEWTEDTFPGYLGNVTAGRVANRFDLGGINFSIDAACASSLAALYVGVSELRNNSSDVVFLSAVDTHNQPGDYLSFCKTHALSRQGRCKTFDASADGIVISEGISVLVLKRLSDAERDGDRIYAIIKGIGGSSDGRDLSLTAPRPAGQMQALRRAYEDARLSPATVGLVEAHGTGTVAGDKAEVEALSTVYLEAGAPIGSTAIGSVKTMIGHTKCAAGLASVIKVAKALYHKVLPPTIGVSTPNPACKFGENPFYINSETRPWLHAQDRDYGRRAAVSAFGFGGTNFHVVLEEYNRSTLNKEAYLTQLPTELFVLKAQSPDNLLKAVNTLIQQAEEALKLSSLPNSPAAGESADNLSRLAQRWYLSSSQISAETEAKQAVLSLVASSLEDLLGKLKSAKQAVEEKRSLNDPRGIYFNMQPWRHEKDSKLAFMFPGQGAQQVDMLKDLSLFFPAVASTFERADQTLTERFATKLSQYIYPTPAFSAETKGEQQKALTNTHIAQPAVAAADRAADLLLREFGLTPDLLGGHSFGEYAALASAGGINEEFLFDVAERRGHLLNTNTEPGAMAAVLADSTTVNKLIGHLKDVVVANINSPKQCIISGSHEGLAAATQVLTDNKLATRPIAVSAAFHSPLMEQAAQKLLTILSKEQFKTPAETVFSNTLAKPYPEDASTHGKLLSEHLVSPVKFQQQVEAMYEAGARVFVEVGPGTILTNLIDDILEGKPHLCISVERAGRHGITQLQHLLGTLAAHGYALNLAPLYETRLIANTYAIPNKTSDKPKLLYLVNSANVKKYIPGNNHHEILSTKSLQKNAGVSSASLQAPLLKPSPVNMAASMHNNGNGQANTNSHTKSATITPAAQAGRQDPEHAVPNGNGQKPSNFYAPNISMPVPLAASKSRAGSEQVMLEFQKTMLEMTNRFLETQQNVMLAYLQAAGDKQPTFPPLTALMPAMPALSPEMAATFSQSTKEPPPAPTSSSSMTAQDSSAKSIQLNSKEYDSIATLPGEQVLLPIGNPQIEEPSPEKLNAEELINKLIEIVSERTGYPAEMLDPSVDLEADLGIDSIKRVEILNSFRKLLPEEKQIELEGGLEKLAGTKTLQAIMDWIREDLANPGKPASQTKEPGLSIANSTLVAEFLSESELEQLTRTPASVMQRGIVQVQELPPACGTLALNKNTWLIFSSQPELGQALGHLLKKEGAEAVVLSQTKNGSSTKRAKDGKDNKVKTIFCNWAQADSLNQTIESIRTEYGTIAGLINCLPFERAKEKAGQSLEQVLSNPDLEAVNVLFGSSKALHVELKNTSQPFTFLVLSGMGGDFASQDPATRKAATALPLFDPCQGAAVGFAKTIAREYEGTKVLALDFSPQEAVEAIASHLVLELKSPAKQVEVGYLNGRRIGLEVTASPLAGSTTTMALGPQSVVLITGGARGITAAIAEELAAKTGAQLILVGKSPLPAEQEDSLTAALNNAREIKAAIMADMKEQGQEVNIPAVEARYQTIMREREIRSNLQNIKQAGSNVHYWQCDVRQAQQVDNLLDKVMSTFGRLDGVIYGAGVIEDALLPQKSPQSFNRVIETKLNGAFALAKKLANTKLGFLIFFSSVVGRTGNAGQCDYVAANETLNKLASLLRRQGCCPATSIMWGPWRGGMAQPELEAIFAKYGWAMIDRSQGKQSFWQELENGQAAEVLLVAEIAGKEKKDPQAAATKTARSGARLAGSRILVSSPSQREYELTLDTSEDLYLQDHKFDDMPVLPMAMAVELFAEAAKDSYPDWVLESITDLDIPSGILFDGPRKNIRICLNEIEASSNQIVLTATIDLVGRQRRTHFKATIRLSKSAAKISKLPAGLPEQYVLPVLSESIDNLPEPGFLYENWLFHGPIFQGITKITALGPEGASGKLVNHDCSSSLAKPGDAQWSVDPILLDSAMQVGGIWARYYLDITALPTGFRSIRMFSQAKPGQYNVIVSVPQLTGTTELKCDLAVYDQSGHLVWLMEGLSGVGSKALNRLAARQTQVAQVLPGSLR